MTSSETVRSSGVARDAGAHLPAGGRRAPDRSGDRDGHPGRDQGRDQGRDRGRDRGDRRSGDRGRSGHEVVSLGRAVDRPCARPACAAPAGATLGFDYAAREASVGPLGDEPRPQAYDLCAPHASRTRPPQGWTLRDHRPADDRREDVPPSAPVDLGGDRTVAVLAAALRATPDAVSEDAVAASAAEVEPATPVPVPTLALADDADVGRPADDRAEDVSAADGLALDVPAEGVLPDGAGGAQLELGLEPVVPRVVRTRPPIAARRRNEGLDTAGAAADW